MYNVLTKVKLEVFVLNLDQSIDAVPEIEDYFIEITNPKEIEVHVKQAQTLNPVFEKTCIPGDWCFEHEKQDQSIGRAVC